MFYSKNLNQFKTIKHCFFSRNFGASKGIYKSLNCGKGSKDEKKNVIENLQIISKKLKFNSSKLILMNQTHSNKVLLINKNNFGRKKINSDAIVTKMKGLTLGVLTADCVPIILYDVKKNLIGCIHAGWRGCISGIIENTLIKFQSSKLESEIVACVGPCIGKKNYEVDLKFFEKFTKISKYNEAFFSIKIKKKLLFDIRGYVNKKLTDNGVKSIDNINMDTFSDSKNFFSYRRSQKLKEIDYGRCISVITLL